jgi:arsenite methyltransferase
VRQIMYQASHYDSVRFVRKPAERLVIHAKLHPGQRVLDVACGTGWATMAAAQAVGNNGKVIGIDIWDQMIDLAREKANSAGLSNVEYLIGDAAALEFNDATFDAVICASSVFFLKDIPKALQEWKRVLKKKGIMAFTSWGETFLQPVLEPLGQCLSRYDGQPPPIPAFINPTNTVNKCREFLTNADFENIEIKTEQLGFYLPDLTAYWQEISHSFISLRLSSLSTADLERFKTEHLAEMESFRTDQGFWLDIPTIISIAMKPL